MHGLVTTVRVEIPNRMSLSRFKPMEIRKGRLEREQVNYKKDWTLASYLIFRDFTSYLNKNPIALDSVLCVCVFVCVF